MTNRRKGAGAKPNPTKPQPASDAATFTESSYYENLLRIRTNEPERFELVASDAAKTALEFYLRVKEKAG